MNIKNNLKDGAHTHLDSLLKSVKNVGKYSARKRSTASRTKKSSARKRSTASRTKKSSGTKNHRVPKNHLRASAQASRTSNLSRWFREKWVDACAYRSGKIKPCGRKNVRSGKFPYCRPLQIASNTPKTVKEFDKKQLKNLCSRKEKIPKQ